MLFLKSLAMFALAQDVTPSSSDEFAWVAIGAFTEKQTQFARQIKDVLKKTELRRVAETAGFDTIVGKDGGALLIPSLSLVRNDVEDLRKLGRFALDRDLLTPSADGTRHFARIGDLPEGLRERVLRDISFIGAAKLDMDQKVTGSAGLDVTLAGPDGRKLRLPLTLGQKSRATSWTPYEAQAAAYRPLTQEDARRLDQAVPPEHSGLSRYFYGSLRVELWGSPIYDERNAAAATRAVTAEISKRVDESQRLMAEARSGMADLFARAEPKLAEIAAAKGRSTDTLPADVRRQIGDLAANARQYGFGSPEEFRAFVKGATVTDLSLGLGFMTAARGPEGLKVFGSEY